MRDELTTSIPSIGGEAHLPAEPPLYAPPPPAATMPPAPPIRDDVAPVRPATTRQDLPEPVRPWRGIAVLVTALVLVGVGFFVGSRLGGDEATPPTAANAVSETTATTTAPVTTDAPTPSTTAPSATAAPLPLPEGLFDASIIGDAAIPSVVTVQVSAQGTPGGGTGSGIIYDGSGHVVTNHHVIEVGTSFTVVLADGRVYEASLVGSDPTTDLAVLAIDAADIVPIAIGTTTELAVGDPAVAVGSPLGLDGGPSLTVGVLSAFGREVRTTATTTLYGMLQTDAPITQGSSGGALVDEQGRLIGITTAVGVSDVGIEGIGFATPIEIVTRVADEIIATGDATQPFLGITGATEFETIDDGGLRPVGVAVQSVDSGSAADVAGLAPGDIISSIDGVDLDTMDELIAQLRWYGTGDTVEMQVIDGSGGVRTISVTLGSR